MKLFHSKQIAEIDAYTISHEPIASLDLMERASTALADEISKQFTSIQNFLFFIGPGNNGGDGLAVARMLADKNFSCELYLIRITEKLSNDAEVNLNRLKKQKKVNINEVTSLAQLPVISAKSVIIDALFGSGLSRCLEGLAAGVVNYMNQSNAKIISIDIPSGLFGEDNSENKSNGIIKATFTLSLQFPKIAFFFAENEKYVGKWKVLPIGLHPGAIEKIVSIYYYLSSENISEKLKISSRFSHKGTFGHALLIAGSYGKMGAAVLSAESCLRTGAGLVTVHIPKKGYDIMQTSLPEAMVSIDVNEEFFSSIKNYSDFNAVGIGPGIGQNIITSKALKVLLDKCKVPIILDADALNILSTNKKLLKKLPVNSILTPHPKEFERLTEKTPDAYHRHLLQIEFAKKHKVFVILKGAYTSITTPNGDCYFNSTGNPGMATAGSGDVLTGIILSLLAQGYSSLDASLIGVYIHGLAGDIARDEMGEESLIAGDIIDNLGKAFMRLKRDIGE